VHSDPRSRKPGPPKGTGPTSHLPLRRGCYLANRYSSLPRCVRRHCRGACVCRGSHRVGAWRGVGQRPRRTCGGHTCVREGHGVTTRRARGSSRSCAAGRKSERVVTEGCGATGDGLAVSHSDLPSRGISSTGDSRCRHCCRLRLRSSVNRRGARAGVHSVSCRRRGWLRVDKCTRRGGSSTQGQQQRVPSGADGAP